MAHQRAFDPQAFLAKVGAGRTLVAYQQTSLIFTQGEAADAVFYLQDGPVKLTVVSPRGVLWRGLSGRAASAHVDGHGTHRLHADAY
jgi:CRP-like cAMP-binding protein